MKESLAILATVGLASAAASAQEWRFELSEPVLSPATPSTFVTLSIDPGPGAYALAGANLKVSATEAGWSDLAGLLGPPWGSHPGQNPGMISGGDVTGISVGQLIGSWPPTPGRIDVWRGTFTVTDFAARSVDLSTETTRFEVYVNPYPDPSRIPRTPIEGGGRIQVVPAPAGLALLGVGAIAYTGRRQRAASQHERSPR